jgi:hypothetical protein
MNVHEVPSPRHITHANKILPDGMRSNRFNLQYLGFFSSAPNKKSMKFGVATIIDQNRKYRQTLRYIE